MTQGLLELGEIMMSASQRRLEVVAQNISNASTPGFRAGRVYDDVLASETPGPSSSVSPNGRIGIATNFDEASLQMTGAPLDLAITGEGFFSLRDGQDIVLVRSAHFERSEDGRIVDASGRALLATDGGDIQISGAVEILADGAVLQDGVPVARIAVVAPDNMEALSSIGGALFRADANALDAVEEPTIRQGMIESSNVETAEEVIQMMTAVRQAETGARVIQTYDTLIGQAITTLGRGQS